MGRKRLFTSESVTEGHPDKICDQVSDAIVDAIKNGVVKINKDTRYQMEFAIATQAYWEKEKDAIVKPTNIDDADYTIDKSRFDPRKWLIHSEKSMQHYIKCK